MTYRIMNHNNVIIKVFGLKLLTLDNLLCSDLPWIQEVIVKNQVIIINWMLENVVHLLELAESH